MAGSLPRAEVTVQPCSRPRRGRSVHVVRGGPFEASSEYAVRVVSGERVVRRGRASMESPSELEVTLGEFDCDGEFELRVVCLGDADASSFRWSSPFVVYAQPEMFAISPGYGPFEGGTHVFLSFRLRQTVDGTSHRIPLATLPVSRDTRVRVSVVSKHRQTLPFFEGAAEYPAASNGAVLGFRMPPWRSMLQSEVDLFVLCTVEVAFDGRSFVGGLLFRYYRQPIVRSISPPTVPSCGGTELRLKTEPMIFPQTGSITVRLRRADGGALYCEGRLDPENSTDTHFTVLTTLPRLEPMASLADVVELDLCCNKQDFPPLSERGCALRVEFSPALTGLSQSYGLCAGGEELELTVSGAETLLSLEPCVRARTDLRLAWRLGGVESESSVFVRGDRFFSTVPASVGGPCESTVWLRFLGRESPVAPQRFRHVDAPSLLSLHPLAGPLSGETTLDVHGRGFCDTARLMVRFQREDGDESIVPGEFLSDRQLFCVTPPVSRSGFYAVSVSLGGTSFAGSRPLLFYFFRPSESLCVEPSACLHHFAASLRVRGENLLVPGGVQLKLLHESGLTHVQPLLSDPPIDWDSVQREFYHRLAELGDLSAALASASGAASELMRESALRELHVVLPAVFPPGAVHAYLSTDDRQFRFSDSDLEISADPVLCSSQPPAVHWRGGEAVRVLGACLRDMGSVSARFLRRGSSPSDPEVSVVAASAEGETGASLTLTSPPLDRCGDWDLSVSLDGGVHWAWPPLRIAVYGRLRVRSVSPRASTAAGGSVVRVEGDGIVETGSMIVRLSAPPTSPEEAAGASVAVRATLRAGGLEATLPRLAASLEGLVRLEASLNGRDWDADYSLVESAVAAAAAEEGEERKAGVSFTVLPMAALRYCTLEGSFLNEVHVLGSGFRDLGGVSVEFTPVLDRQYGAVARREGRVVSEREIVCSMPPLASSFALVRVTLDGGVVFTDAEYLFPFSLVPFVTGVSPRLAVSSSVGGESTVLTLTGENFLPSRGAVVQFRLGRTRKRSLGSVVELPASEGGRVAVRCTAPFFAELADAEPEVEIDVSFDSGRSLGRAGEFHALATVRYTSRLPAVVSVTPASAIASSSSFTAPSPSPSPAYRGEDGAASGLPTSTVSVRVRPPQPSGVDPPYFVRLTSAETGEMHVVRVESLARGGALRFAVPAFASAAPGQTLTLQVQASFNGQNYSPISASAVLSLLPSGSSAASQGSGRRGTARSSAEGRGSTRSSSRGPSPVPGSVAARPRRAPQSGSGRRPATSDSGMPLLPLRTRQPSGLRSSQLASTAPLGDRAVRPPSPVQLPPPAPGRAKEEAPVEERDVYRPFEGPRGARPRPASAQEASGPHPASAQEASGARRQASPEAAEEAPAVAAPSWSVSLRPVRGPDGRVRLEPVFAEAPRSSLAEGLAASMRSRGDAAFSRTLTVLQGCDSNWSGLIDRAGFGEALRRLQPRAGEAEIAALWRFARPTVDGLLDYEQFLRRLRSEGAR